MAVPKLEVLLKLRDDASKQMSAFDKTVDRTAKNFAKAGGAMQAAGLAITAVLGATVFAAAKEEAGVVRLSTAMKNMGIAYEDVKDQLEGWIDAQQQKTSIADTAQRDSLASLIRVTGDLQEAQDLLALSMDVAKGAGWDLERATTTLMFALSGNWGMLERYIPAIKRAATEEGKWLLLRELFAGQSEAFGATLAGQLDLLKNNVGDVAEALGDVLVPMVLQATIVAQSFLRWLKDLAPWVKTVGVFAAVAAAEFLVLGGGFLIVVGLLPSLVAGFTALNVSLIAAGISAGALSTAVIIATGGLVLIPAAIALVVTNFETFKKVLVVIIESIQMFIQSIANVINIIPGVNIQLGDWASGLREVNDEIGTTSHRSQTLASNIKFDVVPAMQDSTIATREQTLALHLQMLGITPLMQKWSDYIAVIQPTIDSADRLIERYKWQASEAAKLGISVDNVRFAAIKAAGSSFEFGAIIEEAGIKENEALKIMDLFDLSTQDVIDTVSELSPELLNLTDKYEGVATAADKARIAQEAWRRGLSGNFLSEFTEIAPGKFVVQPPVEFEPSGVPQFAAGGTVPGVGPQLIIAHGGEEVRRPGQRGGVTVNINGGNFLGDPSEARRWADVIGEQLQIKTRSGFRFE